MFILVVILLILILSLAALLIGAIRYFNEKLYLIDETILMLASEITKLADKIDPEKNKREYGDAEKTVIAEAEKAVEQAKVKYAKRF